MDTAREKTVEGTDRLPIGEAAAYREARLWRGLALAMLMALVLLAAVVLVLAAVGVLTPKKVLWMYVDLPTKPTVSLA